MNNTIYIRGGKSLHGEVNISGSKNATSAVLPALALIDNDQDSIIKNIPDISDIHTLTGIFQEIGMNVKRDLATKSIQIGGKIKNNSLSNAYVPKIRASSLFLGVLLAMTGEVHMPFCGGDQIGDRPLDIHFYVFEKFNIDTTIRDGYIHCKAKQFPLKHTTIYLRYPSVGATENALLLASKADGTTYIYNAACEPEITDMAVALTKMGVKIYGAGTPIIRVTGNTSTLTPITHEVIPDRLELCTFLLSLICTHGKGTIKGGIPEHCISVIHTLADAGVSIDYNEEGTIYVDATDRTFKAIKIQALPYPGVPTDLQPLLAVFSALCQGNSDIQDTVFRDRFSYVSEFMKMGVDMTHLYDHLCVTGPQVYRNAVVHGTDIRSASALLLAALCAENVTTLDGFQHIERGYENFEYKLSKLGADIFHE